MRPLEESIVRVATVERNTKETRITGRVDLDGSGAAEVSTGIGFLDHMLEQLARHSLIDVTLHAEGICTSTSITPRRIPAMWWARRCREHSATAAASRATAKRSSRWTRP